MQTTAFSLVLHRTVPCQGAPVAVETIGGGTGTDAESKNGPVKDAGCAGCEVAVDDSAPPKFSPAKFSPAGGPQLAGAAPAAVETIGGTTGTEGK